MIYQEYVIAIACPIQWKISVQPNLQSYKYPIWFQVNIHIDFIIAKCQYCGNFTKPNTADAIKLH